MHSPPSSSENATPGMSLGQANLSPRKIKGAHYPPGKLDFWAPLGNCPCNNERVWRFPVLRKSSLRCPCRDLGRVILSSPQAEPCLDELCDRDARCPLWAAFASGTRARKTAAWSVKNLQRGKTNPLRGPEKHPALKTRLDIPFRGDWAYATGRVENR